MGRNQPKARRIGVFLNDSLKAVRDKISGVLRFSARHPEWETRIFNASIRQGEFQKILSGWRPDGILLGWPTAFIMRWARKAKCRLIAIDADMPGIATIQVDNAAIAHATARFLLQRGYIHFASVGTDMRSIVRHSRARTAAFDEILRKQGHHAESFEIRARNWSNWTNELHRLAKFVAALPKPCGLMACSDETAKVVVDACRLAHVSIPEQIALVGVDNEREICETLQPTLTSVLPDFEGAGYAAAELLDHLLRRNVQYSLCRTYGVKALIERASTQDVRGGGRLVSAASELIRQKAFSPLPVREIASELRVSTRLLELRFREVLGHGVKEAILRTRLEEVKRLLRETNRPIDEICYSCGWRTATALKALFKKRFGLPMRDFRRSTRPGR